MNAKGGEKVAMHEDVEVQLTGTDGNAFAIIGTVSKALRRAGYRDDAAAFEKQAFESHSYDEILQLAMQTVNWR
jgi:hypothetical protein